MLQIFSLLDVLGLLNLAKAHDAFSKILYNPDNGWLWNPALEEAVWLALPPDPSFMVDHSTCMVRPGAVRSDAR